MKRFQVRWSQWLTSGHDLAEHGTEVLCSGDSAIWTTDENEARRLFNKAFRNFSRIQIVDCVEWTPDYKAGSFNQGSG